MRQYLNHLRSVRSNRYELFWSLLATAFGLWHAGVMPHNYRDELLACAGLMVGLVCAFNTALAWRRMSWLGRIGAAVTLGFLLYFVPLFVWGVVGTTDFADR